MSKPLAPAILLIILVFAVPAALAAPSTGDTVSGGKPGEKTAAKAEAPGPDCAEPLKDEKGKPTEKYDARCTAEMIAAAKARKKAAAEGYDVDKLEGLGLGEKSEAAGSETDYGTFEDLFAPARFDAEAAYRRPRG